MTVAVMYPDDDGDEFDVDEPLYERRMQALSLRNGGMTYTAIATHFKISPSTVRQDVAWAKARVGGEDIESIINTQRAVIRDMRTANYRAMLTGDKDAAASILKGLDHEAKLLGLYAPVRVATGPSQQEFSQRAADLIAAISPNTLKEILRGTSYDPAVRRAGEAGSDAAAEPLDVDTVDSPPFAGPDGSWAPPDLDTVAAGPTVGQPADQAGSPDPDDWPPADDTDDWSNID